MQKFEFIGRLVNSIELAQTKNGHVYGTFVVAVDRPVKEKKTDFYKCICWGDMADNMAIYTSKGSLIYGDGHLEIDNFQNKEGVWNTAVKVVCRTIEYLSKPKQVESNEITVDDIPEEQDFNLPDDKFIKGVD